MGYQIGIINTNDVRYDGINANYNNLTKEKITDLLEDIIDFETVDNPDKMMDVIIEKVAELKDYSLHTSNIYYVNDELYQICHILQSKELYDKASPNSARISAISNNRTISPPDPYQKHADGNTCF